MASVISFSPTSAYKTQTVTIIGVGFTGVTDVQFGGVSADSFNVIDSNTITAIVGAGDTGDVDILTTGGTGGNIGFTYLGLLPDSPIIAGFSPSAQTPGQPVIITGSGFTGTLSVKFGIEEAFTFSIDSDTQITAYPNIDAGSSITVTNGAGSDTVGGFTPIIVKVKITDLPTLGRNMTDEDLSYVFDNVRQILCQATGAQIGANSAGGGGGGDSGGSGVTPVALGSPFKVRKTDGNYEDDGTDTLITDLRLGGKKDYIVYATDLNIEFENYTADAVTASATGVTSASDGTQSNCNALNLSGWGFGSVWDVHVSSTLITSITLVSGGRGYVEGDTFVLDETPGIVYTIESIGTESEGNLVYNPDIGSVTIKGYTLTDGKHISIYADGVTTTPLNNLSSKVALYDKVLAPWLSTIATNGKSGAILPWRLPASLIPVGWQECTDFRGKTLFGQDPSDTAYDINTNPNPLGQIINTPVGSKNVTLTSDQIPVLNSENSFATIPGTSITAYARVRAGGLGHIAINPDTNAYPVDKTFSGRIVQFIEYVG